MNNPLDKGGITQPRLLAHVIAGMIRDRIRRNPTPHQQVERVTQRYPDREITGGGSPDLLQLKDVVVTAVADDDAIMWDAASGMWTNQVPPAASGAVIHNGSTTATGGVWEAVTGAVNGANTRFVTASAYKAGSLHVEQNGKGLTPVSGYVETSAALGQFDTVDAPYTGEEINVWYEEP